LTCGPKIALRLTQTHEAARRLDELDADNTVDSKLGVTPDSKLVVKSDVRDISLLQK
jgi:hypothetical protein